MRPANKGSNSHCLISSRFSCCFPAPLVRTARELEFRLFLISISSAREFSKFSIAIKISISFVLFILFSSCYELNLISKINFYLFQFDWFQFCFVIAICLRNCVSVSIVMCLFLFGICFRFVFLFNIYFCIFEIMSF